MTENPMRRTVQGAALLALAATVSLPIKAESNRAAATSDETSAAATSIIVVPNAFRAYQRGVRQAAAESNEALRRYVWRTRMIYN